MTARRPGFAHLIFFVFFGVVLFAIHAPFFTLRYFWDELGQFVPAALDIMRRGKWVPVSAIPNAHPPAVMAYLAGFWRVTGYSIPATRSAMLLLASVGVMFAFLLAIELCKGLSGAPAFAAVILLVADPLFYTQSMMAQLDMPAMVLGCIALLFFLQERWLLSGAACIFLLLAKETAIVFPAVFVIELLWRGRRWREAAYYAPCFIVLGLWFLYLRHVTGHLFGDPGFTHYNIQWALNPVRVALAILRRIYYLFLADFRWIGAAALIFALRRTRIFATRAWRITAVVAVAQTLLVSFLGGAALERYLVPVLPLLYAAVAAAFTTLSPRLRTAAIPLMAAGLVAGWFLNPILTFPYEDNLAMADFVNLHVAAARTLESSYPDATIYTAWPLTAALRRPDYGYVHRRLHTVETSDLHYATLSRLDPAKVDVLVLYAREWQSSWSVMRLEWVRRLLSRYYEYAPDMTPDQAAAVLHLVPVLHIELHDQWVEILARKPRAGAEPVEVHSRRPSFLTNDTSASRKS
ncbi:MAG TPA: hypothetical protein VFA04_16135 [Bryobacteraceae bacterium]|nr:hypothetical protein [Bryobacteraceae bacterium]